MDIKLIEKARQTAIEMLEDRGFTIPADQQNVSRENVAIMLDNNNINIYVSRGGPTSGPTSGTQVEEVEPNVEEELEDEAEVVEETEEEAEEAKEAEDETNTETVEEAEPGPTVETPVELDTTVAQKGGVHSTQSYVFFHIAAGKFDKKRLVATVSKIRETYESNDINIIIIVKDITTPVLKEVDSETYSNVEVFFYKEMQSNKSKNFGVAPHTLLTEDEIATIAGRYSLTTDQFYQNSPIIYTTSPMARYYGLQDGDMCKVSRRSKGNGRSIAYRSVVRPVI